MSKVKQWAEDTAEKSVDLILKKLKEGQINLENATTNILDVENVNIKQYFWLILNKFVLKKIKNNQKTIKNHQK